MITRNDLTTVSTDIDDFGTIRHNVTHEDDRFVLIVADFDDSSYDRLIEEDLMIQMGIALGAFTREEAAQHLKASLPPKDTGVFRGDKDWNIVGECDDNCKDGVCTRRIASSYDVASLDLAYSMLVDYLNA